MFALAASNDGTVVIASTAAGVFRSADSGNTWVLGDTTLPPAAALAIDPSDATKAYAFAQNGSFYSSNDGGINWKPTGTSLPALYLSRIAIAPGTPSRLYTWDASAVYSSVDGAKTWQALSIPSSGNPANIAAFALAPSQPNTLYATGIPPFGPIYRSTDGGSTWTAGANNIFANGPTAIVADPNDASTVWVVDGGEDVRVSKDGGMTFESTAVLLNGGFTSVAVDPANSARVYAATPQVVMQSTDGGGALDARLLWKLHISFRRPFAHLRYWRQHSADRISNEARCVAVTGHLLHLLVDRHCHRNRLGFAR